MICSCVMLCSSVWHAHLVNVSLWLCSMINLHLHAYVDIMLMYCNCIMWFYHDSAYLHSSLTGLNWTWTIVGWVMVPLNRCWPVQPRLPVWDGTNWVYCRASRRCLQRGKVMCGRYLGRVGWHKPCVLVVVIGIPLSPFGTVSSAPYSTKLVLQMLKWVSCTIICIMADGAVEVEILLIDLARAKEQATVSNAAAEKAAADLKEE